MQQHEGKRGKSPETIEMDGMGKIANIKQEDEEEDHRSQPPISTGLWRLNLPFQLSPVNYERSNNPDSFV